MRFVVPITSLPELTNAITEWSKKLKEPVILQTKRAGDGKAHVRLVGEALPEFVTACEQARDGQKVVLPEPDIHVANDQSSYVGEVGKKVELEVTLYHVVEFNGDFGTSYIHKMRDDAGNELVWFSSRERFRENRRYKLKGTVKEHTEYEDRYTGNKIQQTKLLRCKFEDITDGPTEVKPEPKPKPKTKKTKADWCDVCKAPQMVLPNGEHLCAVEEDTNAPF